MWKYCIIAAIRIESQWGLQQAPHSASPVRQNNFQCRYKVWNHYVDPFQVRAEQSWGVQDNTGQNRPADEVRYLKALDEDHVEPVINSE